METKKMYAIEDAHGNRVPFARYEMDELDWAKEDLEEIYKPKYPKADLRIVVVDHI